VATPSRFDRQTRRVLPTTSPSRVITPVVTVDLDSLDVQAFWGTGFLVGPGVLMSAKHVLGVEVPDGQGLATFMRRDDSSPVLHPLFDVHLDVDFDIGVASVSEPLYDEHLRIAEGDSTAMNLDVLSVQYARVLEHDPRVKVRMSQSHHKGYVVQRTTETFGHRQPTKVLDVSFPALEGASGAPVVTTLDWTVIGMVVANVQRHLLPAQITRTVMGTGDDEQAKVEEIRYYLPFGQAIRSPHLRETLKRAGR
jgi:hypothetical protein